MKSNNNIDVLKTIYRNGCGFDIVSINELKRLIDIGIDLEDILFTSESVKKDDIKELEKFGVGIQLGSFSPIEDYFLRYKDIGVRFNTGYGVGKVDNVSTGGDSVNGVPVKFGIPMNQIESLQYVLSQKKIKITGIHHHVGSGWKNKDMDIYKNAFINLLSIYDFYKKNGHDIEYINLGGGFGIPDYENESDLDLDKFWDMIYSTIREKKIKIKNLIIEPGTYISGNMGIFIAKVNYVEDKNGYNFIYIDSGLNHFNSPAYYGYYHQPYVLNKKGKLKDTKEKKLYTIVGNICESGDIFAVNVELSEVKSGDFIVFMNAGAYGYVLSNNYHLYEKPLEYVIQ